MKKILLLATVCGIVFTGCAVRMSTSIKTVNAGLETVRSLPLTADLNISERKVRGEAYGKAHLSGDEDRLVREAVARALGQYPPKAEAPDVLVGMNVYKERNGKNMSVVVTGYPGWYYNFRTVQTGDSAWLILTSTGGVVRRGAAVEGLPVAAPGQITLGELPKPKGASGRRYYLGANMMALGSRSLTGEWICLEGGMRGNNGISYGLEFGGGFFGDSSERGRSESIGGGFNVSRTYNLPADIGQLVYGVSAGFWYGYYHRYKIDKTALYNNDESQEDNMFGGPFVKLRWKFVELSYRGLIGKEELESKHRYGSDGYIYGKPDYDEKLTWVSQLKLGVYFKL